MSAERRRHRLFFTKHTEYHLRGDECVGVRDRGSGLWLLDHASLRLRALRLPKLGSGSEWVGRRIQFWGRHMDVLTSPVLSVGRPERPHVVGYVSQARAGEIGSEPETLLEASLP
jgi:hypothetical protein